MKKNYLHAYAIIRYEAERDESIAIDQRITVKKVVFDPDYAEAEVRRLNDLNRDKGAYYFWHITRIDQPFADKQHSPDSLALDEFPQPDEAATAG